MIAIVSTLAFAGITEAAEGETKPKFDEQLKSWEEYSRQLYSPGKKTLEPSEARNMLIDLIQACKDSHILELEDEYVQDKLNDFQYLLSVSDVNRHKCYPLYGYINKFKQLKKTYKGQLNIKAYLDYCYKEQDKTCDKVSGDKLRIW